MNPHHPKPHVKHNNQNSYANKPLGALAELCPHTGQLRRFVILTIHAAGLSRKRSVHVGNPSGCHGRADSIEYRGTDS